MKEGEGMIQLDGCPDHGMKYLYRTVVGIVWHEKCSVEGCDHVEHINNQRRRANPIDHEDRRRNET